MLRKLSLAAVPRPSHWASPRQQPRESGVYLLKGFDATGGQAATGHTSRSGRRSVRKTTLGDLDAKCAERFR